jgi:hypothetical protein
MELTTKIFNTQCKEVYSGAVRIGVILKLANEQWAAYTLGSPKGVRIEGLPMHENWEVILELWKEKLSIRETVNPEPGQ